MKKNHLPTRTSVAVWFIFSAGVIGTTVALIVPQIIQHRSDESEWSLVHALLALISIAVGFLYIIPGILIRIKKRSTWKAAVTILCLGFIGFSGLVIFYTACPEYYPWYVFLSAVIIYVVPLILVIGDRKNYFDMVRQRELEKKQE